MNHTLIAVRSVLLSLGMAACAAPGVDIAPRADDFAFIEMRLQG